MKFMLACLGSSGETPASLRLKDSLWALPRRSVLSAARPKFPASSSIRAGTGLCCWAAEPGTRAAAFIPQNAHGK